MREIKFRAWDGKSFESWNSLTCPSYSMPEVFCQGKLLEQFTGLRDKNGREIYEGDILQSISAHSVDRRIAIVSWCDQDTGYEVMPVGCSGEPWRLGSINPRFWEVVGNIHENPDLLHA